MMSLSISLSLLVRCDGSVSRDALQEDKVQVYPCWISVNVRVGHFSFQHLVFFSNDSNIHNTRLKLAPGGHPPCKGFI